VTVKSCPKTAARAVSSRSLQRMPLSRRCRWPAGQSAGSAAQFGEIPKRLIPPGIVQSSVVQPRCAEMARAFSYLQLLTLASNCEAVRVSPHCRISWLVVAPHRQPGPPCAAPPDPPRVRRAAGLQLAPEPSKFRTQPRHHALTRSAHALASQKPLVLHSRRDVFALPAPIQDLLTPKLLRIGRSSLIVIVPLAHCGHSDPMQMRCPTQMRSSSIVQA
jgi:hypothetical protein